MTCTLALRSNNKARYMRQGSSVIQIGHLVTSQSWGRSKKNKIKKSWSIRTSVGKSPEIMRQMKNILTLGGYLRRAVQKEKRRMDWVKGRWGWVRGKVDGAEGLLMSKSPWEQTVVESRLDLYEALTSHDPRGKVWCTILKIKQATPSLFTSARLERHQA